MSVEPCKKLAFLMIIITSPFMALEHIHVQGTCLSCSFKDGNRQIEEVPLAVPSSPPHDDEEMGHASIFAVEDEEEEEKPHRRKKRINA